MGTMIRKCRVSAVDRAGQVSVTSSSSPVNVQKSCTTSFSTSSELDALFTKGAFSLTVTSLGCSCLAAGLLAGLKAALLGPFAEVGIAGLSARVHICLIMQYSSACQFTSIYRPLDLLSINRCTMIGAQMQVHYFPPSLRDGDYSLGVSLKRPQPNCCPHT
jgi:hypothetical protein